MIHCINLVAEMLMSDTLKMEGTPRSTLQTQRQQITTRYLHVRHHLTEADQETVGHRAVLLLVFVLEDPGSSAWRRWQQHFEETVSQQGVLGLPLGLTVQVLEERGQHVDVGWVTSAAR